MAINMALKSVLANPWAIIAVGTAMVAAAAIMTARSIKTLKRMLRNLPKVVLPTAQLMLWWVTTPMQVLTLR